MDVLDVLQDNVEADCSQLGVVAYALTPCGHCRAKAVRLLDRRRASPRWLEDEWRFDSTHEHGGAS
jgi:hypothetical protein